MNQRVALGAVLLIVSVLVVYFNSLESIAYQANTPEGFAGLWIGATLFVTGVIGFIGAGVGMAWVFEE